MSMRLTDLEQHGLTIPLPLRTLPKGVAKAKKQDLVSLCKAGLIKSDFCDFFESLPEEGNQKSEDKENIKKKK